MKVNTKRIQDGLKSVLAVLLKKHGHGSKRLPHIPAKDREYFTSNLASLVKAGLPLNWALQTLEDNTQSKPLKLAVAQMRHDVDEGSPFWKAIERSRIVSAETLMLTRIGEQSGNLPENLRLAAQQEAKQRVFRSKIRTALMYPLFVLGTTAVVGVGISWFLLPRLSQTFGQLGIKLPLISRIILGFGTFMQHYGFEFVLTLVVLAVALCVGYSKLPALKRIGRVALLHIPGISSLISQVELARFGYLLGSMLEAGISVTESFNLLHGATTDPTYQALYSRIAKSFDEGYNFRIIFSKNKHDNFIPNNVQQMIIAGEYSGTLAASLQNIGKMYEEKADITAANLEKLLEPMLLILVWLGVLTIAIGVILPIYSLVGNFNHTQ